MPYDRHIEMNDNVYGGLIYDKTFSVFCTYKRVDILLGDG